MARGSSGRIVLEINPSKKGELYDALTKDGKTLKDWFLGQAEHYLNERKQPSFFSIIGEPKEPYGKQKSQTRDKQKRTAIKAVKQ
jgi:hypothetical protein